MIADRPGKIGQVLLFKAGPDKLMTAYIDVHYRSGSRT
jgi:hypothetical protein